MVASSTTPTPAREPSKSMNTSNKVINLNGTEPLESATPQVPRPLTPAERHQVRLKLDNHFDDAVGRYIDGYSDQRVGAELDIPWATIRDIRELAYGPLREDDRVVALRLDLDKVKQQVADIEAKLKAL